MVREASTVVRRSTNVSSVLSQYSNGSSPSTPTYRGARHGGDLVGDTVKAELLAGVNIVLRGEAVQRSSRRSQHTRAAHRKASRSHRPGKRCATRSSRPVPIHRRCARPPRRLYRRRRLRCAIWIGERVQRQVGDLADSLEIHVAAHQDRLAVLARGLDGARETELDRCAALRAVRPLDAHAVTPGRPRRRAARACGPPPRPLRTRAKVGREIPLRARTAAEQVQPERTVLGERVTAPGATPPAAPYR